MGEVKVNGIEYLNFHEGHSEGLISAISKIYYIFYDVDLKSDSFIKYHATRLVSDFTDKFTSSHDCLQGIADVMFVPEHKEMMADFYETATWPERLKENDTIYLDAKGIKTGWIRTNLIVAARDEKGVPTHVFVAIQSVNNIKLKELEQTEQLEDQLKEITSLNLRLEENKEELEMATAEQENQLEEINALNEQMISMLNSLADIYYSMHLINLIEDTVIEYRAQNNVKDIVNHRHGAVQMMEKVMSTATTEAYLDKTLKFTDLTTLRERMKSTKLITCEFVGKNIGWTKASFITVRSDKSGMPVEVMFVTRSIDAEKKKEEALIRTSNTDALTNLLNRRAYETEFSSCDISSDDLVYIAFDLNELKKVNDTLGHAAGDEMIIGAADCIKDSFGRYGKVFRIGGDEFAALIHISTDELETVKNEFADRVNGWSGKLVNNMNIAAGYSVCSNEKDCSNLHEISILADKRMYENKTEYYRKKGLDIRRN